MDENRRTIRLRVEGLEDRLAPAIVAVNGGGNTPNGTYTVDYSVVASNGNFPPGQFPVSNPARARAQSNPNEAGDEPQQRQVAGRRPRQPPRGTPPGAVEF